MQEMDYRLTSLVYILRYAVRGFLIPYGIYHRLLPAASMLKASWLNLFHFAYAAALIIFLPMIIISIALFFYIGLKSYGVKGLLRNLPRLLYHAILGPAHPGAY